jgi:hypothetical protein
VRRVRRVETTARTAGVGTNRPAFGPGESQTRAPSSGIVTAEGGGSIPTLDVGGGMRFSGASASGVGRA